MTLSQEESVELARIYQAAATYTGKRGYKPLLTPRLVECYQSKDLEGLKIEYAAAHAAITKPQPPPRKRRKKDSASETRLSDFNVWVKDLTADCIATDDMDASLLFSTPRGLQRLNDFLQGLGALGEKGAGLGAGTADTDTLGELFEAVKARSDRLRALAHEVIRLTGAKLDASLEDALSSREAQGITTAGHWLRLESHTAPEIRPLFRVDNALRRDVIAAVHKSWLVIQSAFERGAAAHAREYTRLLHAVTQLIDAFRFHLRDTNWNVNQIEQLAAMALRPFAIPIASVSEDLWGFDGAPKYSCHRSYSLCLKYCADLILDLTRGCFEWDHTDGVTEIFPTTIFKLVTDKICKAFCEVGRDYDKDKPSRHFQQLKLPLITGGEKLGLCPLGYLILMLTSSRLDQDLTLVKPTTDGLISRGIRPMGDAEDEVLHLKAKDAKGNTFDRDPSKPFADYVEDADAAPFAARAGLYNSLMISQVGTLFPRLKHIVAETKAANSKLLSFIILGIIYFNESPNEGEPAKKANSRDLRNIRAHFRWVFRPLAELITSPIYGPFATMLINNITRICDTISTQAGGIDVFGKEFILNVMGDMTRVLRQCASGSEELRDSLPNVRAKEEDAHPHCSNPRVWQHGSALCLCLSEEEPASSVCADCHGSLHPLCAHSIDPFNDDEGQPSNIALCAPCFNARVGVVANSWSVASSLEHFTTILGKDTFIIKNEATGDEAVVDRDHAIHSPIVQRRAKACRLAGEAQIDLVKASELRKVIGTANRRSMSKPCEEAIWSHSEWYHPEGLFGDLIFHQEGLAAAVNAQMDQTKIHLLHRRHDYELILPAETALLQTLFLVMRSILLELAVPEIQLNTPLSKVVPLVLPRRPMEAETEETIKAGVLKNFLVMMGSLTRWELRLFCPLPAAAAGRGRAIAAHRLGFVSPRGNYRAKPAQGSSQRDYLPLRSVNISDNWAVWTNGWRQVYQVNMARLASDLEVLIFGHQGDPLVSIRRAAIGHLNHSIQRNVLAVAELLPEGFFGMLTDRMVKDPSVSVKSGCAAIFVNLINSCVEELSHAGAVGVKRKARLANVQALVDLVEAHLPKPLKAILNNPNTATSTRKEAINASIHLINRASTHDSPSRGLFQRELILTLLGLFTLKDAPTTQSVLGFLWDFWFAPAMDPKHRAEYKDAHKAAVFSEVMREYATDQENKGSCDPPLLELLVAYGIQRMGKGNIKKLVTTSLESYSIRGLLTSPEGVLISRKFSKHQGSSLINLLTKYRDEEVKHTHSLAALDENSQDETRESLTGKIERYLKGQWSVLNALKIVGELAPLPHRMFSMVEFYMVDDDRQLVLKKFPSLYWWIMGELMQITCKMVATLESSQKTAAKFAALIPELKKLEDCVPVNVNRSCLRTNIMGHLRLVGQLKKPFQKAIGYRLTVFFALTQLWQYRKMLADAEREEGNLIVNDIASVAELDRFSNDAYYLCTILETLDLNRSTVWARAAPDPPAPPSPAGKTPPRMKTPNRVLSTSAIETPCSDLLLSSDCLKVDNGTVSTSLPLNELLDGDFLVSTIDNYLKQLHSHWAQKIDGLPPPVSLFDNPEISDSNCVDLQLAIFNRLFMGCTLLSTMAYVEDEAPNRPDRPLPEEHYYTQDTTFKALNALQKALTGMQHVILSNPNFSRSRRWLDHMTRMIRSSFHLSQPSTFFNLKAQEAKAPWAASALRGGPGGQLFRDLVKAYHRHQLWGLQMVAELTCHFEKDRPTEAEDEEGEDPQRLDSPTASLRGSPGTAPVEQAGKDDDWVAQNLAHQFLSPIRALCSDPWMIIDVPLDGFPEDAPWGGDAVLNTSWSLCCPSLFSLKWTEYRKNQDIYGSISPELRAAWDRRNARLDRSDQLDLNPRVKHLAVETSIQEVMEVAALQIQKYVASLKILTILHRQGEIKPQGTIGIGLVLLNTLGVSVDDRDQVALSPGCDLLGLRMNLQSLLSHSLKQLSLGPMRDWVPQLLQQSIPRGFEAAYSLGVFDFHVNELQAGASNYSPVAGIRLGKRSATSPFTDIFFNTHFNTTEKKRKQLFSLYLNPLDALAQQHPEGQVPQCLQRMAHIPTASLGLPAMPYATLAPHLDLEMAKFDLPQALFAELPTGECIEEGNEARAMIPASLYVPLLFVQWTVEHLASIQFHFGHEISEFIRELNRVISQWIQFRTIITQDEGPLLGREGRMERLVLATSAITAVLELKQCLLDTYPLKEADLDAIKGSGPVLEGGEPPSMEPSPTVEVPPNREQKKAPRNKSAREFNVEGVEDSMREVRWDVTAWYMEKVVPSVRVMLACQADAQDDIAANCFALMRVYGDQQTEAFHESLLEILQLEEANERPKPKPKPKGRVKAGRRQSGQIGKPSARGQPPPSKRSRGSVSPAAPRTPRPKRQRARVAPVVDSSPSSGGAEDWESDASE